MGGVALLSAGLAATAVFSASRAGAQTPILLESQQLVASDSVPASAFGFAVAVSGDVAVIGDWIDGDNGPNSGSAYVYRYDGTDWVEEQKLLPSDGGIRRLFGDWVTVSGDVAAINDLTGTYFYRYDGTDWVEEQKLPRGGISVSGDVAVLSTRGGTFVYCYDGSQWTEAQELLASDGGALGFGDSTAISGDVVVIGDSFDDDSGKPFHSAYVYRYDGVRWVEEQKLVPEAGPFPDLSGYPVSVSGDVAVISTRGAAFVYRYDGAAWVGEQALRVSDGAAAEFGVSAAVSGDVVVVGAMGDDDNGARSGSAYVYRYDGIDWVEEWKLLPSDPTPLHEFGWAVSISGPVIVVGSQDTAFKHASAYVYAPALPTTVGVDIRPDSDLNPINPSSAGSLPVAILGSERFDVADADPTTLAFGPNGASIDRRPGPHLEDANGDGLTDLIAHFRIAETGIASGDAKACISGETFEGTAFEGCDALSTVPLRSAERP